ncbi:AI-2E family transporter YdiK [Burkholderiaceae bacterium FT117]|uniref:AI-2E family transporter YdiK n=1 Tax=Zeimonas sediminis TaxID=2944268 RepID=UPI002342CD16|nr:AI-2E family transporter YdiK [Zeimonas sediminis]MCM5572228.1 AI-2E family transporter YdiK [Zeimonas sediminis]
MSQPRADLFRSTLSVLFIVGMVVLNAWVLQPFLMPTIWAATIVAATWPLMLRLQARLGGRRWPAVGAMTLGLFALLVAPLTFGVLALLDHVDDIVALVGRLSGFRLPPAPEWLLAVPFVGPRIEAAWEKTIASGAEGLLAVLEPHAVDAIQWVAGELGLVGVLVMQSLMVVVLAAVMYARGEAMAAALKRVGRRLGGAHGESLVHLSAQAVRGIFLGVGVTAVAQAVVGGAGLAIAGVPHAVGLTIVMFVLSLAQLGPLPVLVPAVAWLFWAGAAGWAVFLLGVCILVSALDNFLRPWLIRKGVELPLLLVFGGVVGGMLAFGLVGIFIGPMVIAIAHAMLQAWLSQASRR